MENLKERTARGLFWGVLNSGATQVLNVEGSNIAEISLYSAIGKVVYSGRPANNHTEINVANLVRGMYLVRITTHDGQTSIKKVILK